MCIFRTAIRISTDVRKLCTHKASDNWFNERQIMECIVKYATGIYLQHSKSSSEI